MDEAHELIVGAEDAGLRLDRWLGAAPAELRRAAPPGADRRGPRAPRRRARRAPSARLRPGQAARVERARRRRRRCRSPRTSRSASSTRTRAARDRQARRPRRPPGRRARHRHAGQRAARTTCTTSRASAACCGPASCTASTAARRGCWSSPRTTRPTARWRGSSPAARSRRSTWRSCSACPRAPQGEIEPPIGRDPVQRQKMSVRAPRGREARTSSWAIAERFDGAALLRVRIHTGRTHQIRVHLASIGHPVAGDAIYGGTRTPSSRGRGARGARVARAAGAARRAPRLHPPGDAGSGWRSRPAARGPAAGDPARCGPPRDPEAGCYHRRPCPRPSRPPACCSTAASTTAACCRSTSTRSSEPGGVRGTREVVRQSGSVAALPVLDDGRIVLVRQYRYAVADFVWELPAGRRDPGENRPRPARAASSRRRSACAPARSSRSLDVLDDAGLLRRGDAPLPRDRARAGPGAPGGDERIEPGRFTLEEALGMVGRGEIREGKTLVALLLERPQSTGGSLSGGRGRSAPREADALGCPSLAGLLEACALRRPSPSSKEGPFVVRVPASGDRDLVLLSAFLETRGLRPLALPGLSDAQS